jgi:hypothetical protein
LSESERPISRISAPEIERVCRLAEDADERYFALQETGADERTWYNWFVTARFLVAFKEAFGDTTAEGACSAIYELTCMRDDAAELIECIANEARRYVSGRV